MASSALTESDAMRKPFLVCRSTTKQLNGPQAQNYSNERNDNLQDVPQIFASAEASAVVIEVKSQAALMALIFASEVANIATGDDATPASFLVMICNGCLRIQLATFVCSNALKVTRVPRHLCQ
jgi:hypothetical protein